MQGVKIVNLHRDDTNEHQWHWHIEYADPVLAEMNRRKTGVYYTNRNGEGIYFQSESDGEVMQLAGYCQFTSCKTYSGMRKKLLKWHSA